MSIESPRQRPDRTAQRPSGRRSRGGPLLPAAAALAVAGLVFAAGVAPQSAASDPARSTVQTAASGAERQLVDLVVAAAEPTTRDAFAAEAAPPPAPPAWATAPAVGVPDPGTAKAIGYEMVMAHGWAEEEWHCLSALWTRESNWNTFSHNTSSGAYGIPQALPGEKMASAGGDWATNPETQIRWGIGYIQGRYGTPCGAWQHSEESGWY